MHIQELRAQIGREEFDYVLLKSLLGNYRQPKNKIRIWLYNKDLIRVKKGLYIFGPNSSREPYSKEVLANLIYGPSAISLEYALSFYGFIPERVTTITCITNQRNKKFLTPIGTFTYRYLNPKKYMIGINQYYLSEKNPILIATPEKAIADLLYFEQEPLHTIKDIKNYLFENMRMDPQLVYAMDLQLLKKIKAAYKKNNINLLLQLLGSTDE